MRAHWILLFCFVSLMALAQGDLTGTNPEGCTLRVRVVWPNERAVQEPVHLQLLNHSGIPVQETMTDKQGNGQFQRLAPGSYKVKADSPDVRESVLDSVEIMENETFRQETLHVTPRDPNAAVGGTPQGPVSSTDLNVPGKAKKEREKGAEAFGKQKLPEAIEHFSKAVEIYPQYARAWNDLGVVKAKAGDKAGGKEAWQKSIEADAKFPSPYLNLARTDIAEKQPAEAEKMLNQVLASDPKNAEALYLLFNTQYSQNQAKQAIETEQKLHALEHKRFADVHVFAGQLLLNQNQDKLAMAEFETYLKEAPDGPRAAAVRKAMSQIQAQGAPAQ